MSRRPAIGVAGRADRLARVRRDVPGRSDGPRPFTIHVPDAALDDLRRRLEGVRWPWSLNEETWEARASPSCAT